MTLASFPLLPPPAGVLGIHLLSWVLEATSYFGVVEEEEGPCERAGKGHTVRLGAEPLQGCGSPQGLRKETSFLKQVMFLLCTVPLQGICFGRAGKVIKGGELNLLQSRGDEQQHSGAQISKELLLFRWA